MSSETFDLKAKVTVDGVSQAKSELSSFESTTADASTSLGLLAKGATLVAGAFAAWKIAEQVKVFAELAGTQQTLGNAFNVLTRNVDEATISLDSLREATMNTVSDTDLLRAANVALSLGLPIDRMNELFESATILGNAMGIDTTQAVDVLGRAIGRLSTKVLDDLGIIISADEAYRKYAASVGVLVSELDDSQKRLAWQAEAMDKLMQKSNELKGTTSELSIELQAFDAWVDNTKESMGEFAGASIISWSRFGRAVDDAFTNFNVWLGVIDETAEETTEDITENFDDMSTDVEKTIGEIVTIGETEFKRLGKASLIAVTAWESYMKGVNRELDKMFEGSVEAYRNAIKEFEKARDDTPEFGSTRGQRMFEFYERGNPAGSFADYEKFLAAGGTQSEWEGLSSSERQALLSGGKDPTHKEYRFRHPSAGTQTGWYRDVDDARDERRSIDIGNVGGSWVRETKTVKGAKMGFKGWVNQPTMFMVGEAGAEYLSVTPRGRATGGGREDGGARSNPSVIINAPNLTSLESPEQARATWRRVMLELSGER